MVWFILFSSIQLGGCWCFWCHLFIRYRKHSCLWLRFLGWFCPTWSLIGFSCWLLRFYHPGRLRSRLSELWWFSFCICLFLILGRSLLLIFGWLLRLFIICFVRGLFGFCSGWAGFWFILFFVNFLSLSVLSSISLLNFLFIRLFTKALQFIFFGHWDFLSFPFNELYSIILINYLAVSYLCYLIHSLRLFKRWRPVWILWLRN